MKKTGKTAFGLIVLMLAAELITYLVHASIYINVILAVFFAGHAVTSWMKKQLRLTGMIAVIIAAVALLVLAVYY